MAKTTPLVSCSHLSLSYEAERPVLDDVSFSLAPGSFHFLTGPSGAGKSSLLSILSLNLRPSKGQLEMFGQDTGVLTSDQLPHFRRRVGLVFQDYRLLNHLSVAENVALPLKIMGENPATIEKHVKEMLLWIGMEMFADTKPTALSGGQKQRVAIARAVIIRPDLILADEPTGNLDPLLSQKCMRLFDALHQQGTTLVIATHDEQLVAEMGHPRLKLKDGKIVQEKPAKASS